MDINPEKYYKPSMDATHGGKGSAPRRTNKQLYDENYDRIFGKKKVDNNESHDIIPEIVGHSYNGSTSDFDSDSSGSTPL